MIRVMIADDHEVVRRGLRDLFAAAPDIQVVAEAAHGRAVLDVLATQEVDVVTLDLSLPRVSGGEVLRRIREAHPSVRVLVLSMYSEHQHASQMIQAGAAGYLSKDRSLTDVLAAVRQVAAGEVVVPHSLPRGARSAHCKGLPHEDFTPREFQVFMLVLQGRSGVEISAELNLANSTVSTHLANVKEKLGLRTTAEIVAYAHRTGLLG